jgi:hypothetical protein
MPRHWMLCAATLYCAAISGTILASEVRYFVEDGVTYRETRRRVRRPVSETQVADREVTVYRERYTTDMRELVRTEYTPVVRHHWEPRWHGWWNPFQDPYVAYHLVSSTYWQPYQRTVRTPVSKREWVPEKRVVRAPVTKLRFVEQEEVSRVAVNPPPRFARQASPSAPTSNHDAVVGIARLDGDPPRRGTGKLDSGWRTRR